MKSQGYYPKEPSVSAQKQELGFSLERTFKLILPKWYLFLISLIIMFYCGNFYINHTLTVSRVSSLIQVNEDKESNSINDQIMKGIGLPPGAQNIQNQILVLSSRAMTERTLEKLPFETEIYYHSLRNKLPIYPNAPFSISLVKGLDLPRNTEFELTYIGGKRFSLKTNSKANFVISKQFSFGDTIDFPGGAFRIDVKDNEILYSNINRKLYYVTHDKKSLIRMYNKRLKVERVSREGTTIKLSMEGTNSSKDVDFVNTLTDLFISRSLDKKNLEAARRVQFIDDQLVGISDSLVLTENKLQKFRSENRIMDLSTQGQAIINQSIELENQRARIKIETDYYNYLEDYLKKDVADEVPIAPATMGITDPGLMRLVAELAVLQGQLSSKNFGEKNPLQNQLIQKIKSTKEALLETLKGLSTANSIAVAENHSQIQNINSQASTLPGTERKLLGIERKFKLNDELNTFLLERRAEQQMQKASNMPDNEIIDYADKYDVVVVAPKPLLIYVLSWFAGLGIPLFVILMVDLLNKRIKEEDLTLFTDLPIAGNIPHNTFKTDTVVLEYPESAVTEAFRILRSRMQFFTKEIKSPVILVTSSLAEDGKTFVAINLASVYSLMGMKTILVGFDLRRPKIYDNFNLNNENGLSTWLIGKNELKDVVKSTIYKNLFILPSGPVPPNPAELVALHKSKELIDLLRENFDCIIIDSSPIGLVSDTYHLTSLVDSCLYIIRIEKTLKEKVAVTLNEMRMSGITGVSLILNDLKVNPKMYGYGGKNVYTKDNKKVIETSEKVNDLSKVKS